MTDALSRFDAAQGVQFETFATQRIRGAMLDRAAWQRLPTSRGTRKQASGRSNPPVAKLEQKFGRAPVESEIAGNGHPLAVV